MRHLELHLHVRDRVVGLIWRVLGERGRQGWQAQTPFVQRAVPPLLIAAIVLLVFLPWRAPDWAFVILLAITYAVYLLPRSIRRFALPVTILGLAVAYPFYVDHLFRVPVFESFPQMTTMVPMVIFAMMAIGLNMVVGYAGLLDLGYVAFYAIGAYTAAWLASPQFAGRGVDLELGGVGVAPGIGGIHISVWIVLVLAACLTGFFGVVIGLPTLRLRGDYLAIVTLGFGEILPQVARNGDNLFGTGFNLTNGPQGINPIDSVGFGGWLDNKLGLPADFLNLGDHRVRAFYWVAIAMLLITLFCSARLRDSRLGRAWIAIREDETAAAAMGVPLMRTKTWAYAAGAFFGGIAGAWFAVYKGGVFPDDFFFNISVLILCMVILGGMGNIWGVILGAGFLSYLDQEGLANIGGWLNDNILPCNPSNASAERVVSAGCVNAPLVSFGIYGTIIVLVMLFRPQGLVPEARRKLELETGVHDEPLYDIASGAISTEATTTEAI